MPFLALEGAGEGRRGCISALRCDLADVPIGRAQKSGGEHHSSGAEKRAEALADLFSEASPQVARRNPQFPAQLRDRDFPVRIFHDVTGYFLVKFASRIGIIRLEECFRGGRRIFYAQTFEQFPKKIRYRIDLPVPLRIMRKEIPEGPEQNPFDFSIRVQHGIPQRFQGMSFIPEIKGTEQDRTSFLRPGKNPVRLAGKNQIQLSRFQFIKVFIDLYLRFPGEETGQNVAVVEERFGIPVSSAIIKLNAVRHKRRCVRISRCGIGKIRQGLGQFQICFAEWRHFDHFCKLYNHFRHCHSMVL